MTDNINTAEIIGKMDSYRTVKEVEAAKITKIDGLLIHCTSKAGGRIGVSATRGWMAKHNPQPGGYIVRYRDDYVSYTPPEPFEECATLLSEEEEVIEQLPRKARYFEAIKHTDDTASGPTWVAYYTGLEDVEKARGDGDSLGSALKDALGKALGILSVQPTDSKNGDDWFLTPTALAHGLENAYVLTNGVTWLSQDGKRIPVKDTGALDSEIK